MDRIESLHQEISVRYIYNPELPRQVKEGYWAFDATHKDLKIPVALKLIRSPPGELTSYLRRLKQIKVENIIKIYQIFDNEEGLFLSTEPVPFSNMRYALQKCNKLDDFDAIFISKVILGVHVDLLRAGVNWFGTEQDIQFTANGLKLSWNNSIPFETECPFPLILSRLAGKMEVVEQKILPFPKSKVLEDLIALSARNASEISLSPHLKKKEKISKKKGRNWICLKEYKNDFDYYQENLYFGVHKEIGFARIKAYEEGKLDEDIMTLNKTKTTFTRVVETYDDNGKSYIVSEYSNDGSLFNYVNKLKSNAIALKEDQIQFFFYSLFQPLKLIQDSSIQSLCMLHIKNIYIQNGIPKIGEPVPMNSNLKDQLKDKAEVPDFYHPGFKKNASVKTNTYDTYSLGVLMYKLMYTQYPIFPQGKVHIPTTPPYSRRLKSTLEMFLNDGGMLKDLEKKIEVSEEVAKQVRINKGKLLQQKKSQQKKIGLMVEQFDDDIQRQPKKEEVDTEQHEEQQDEEDTEECWRLCCQQLQNPHKHKSIMLNSLQESPYSSYRLCTKGICILILYIFLFYLFFIQNTFKMLSNHSSLSRINVTISTVKYEITVSNENNFYTIFNTTDRSQSSLLKTGCYVNNYNGSSVDYSSAALTVSHQIYIAFGFILMVVILVFKIIQISKFDFVKTLYNMSNIKANFNMSNYLIFNFIFCSFVNDHYIFFNQVFNSITDTCLGVNYTYVFGSTTTYFDNKNTFVAVFFVTFALHFLVFLLMLIMVVKTDTIRYTRLFNPILIFLPLVLIYSIVVRVGVISSYFYPSLMKDISVFGTFFTSISYVNIIGIIPEIMFLFQILIEVIVDWLFWLLFDKKRRMLINDISSAGIIV